MKVSGRLPGRDRQLQTIMRLHRISSTFYRWRLPVAGRLVEGIIRVLFGAVVPGRATTDRSAFFEHSGLGVVLNELSVIGENCRIGVHVVLGGKAPIIGAPTLEDGVIVHAGAKLIGPITVGEGTVIAANAVVIGDLPPRSMAAGVPAVVKKGLTGQADENV